MLRRTVIAVVVSLSISMTTLTAAAQDAQSWLTRMSHAVEALSYQGNFVHMQGGDVETLHITHLNDDGRIGERILALDGVAREIIRNGDEVQCIFPDRQAVLLEERRDVSPLVSALPTYSDELRRHYEFTLHETARIVERQTQIVSIKPKDGFRYGYMLWLDQETAMPLKSQLMDEHGNVLEQILFTQLEISDSIPRSALEPTINTEGFTMFRPPAAVAQSEEDLRLRASRLPGGFALSAATHGPIAGSPYPVGHLVYSDGLATVSVFIEDPKSTPEVATGHSRVGSSNAFSLSLDGRQVTAVGEVPRRTVESIAISLRAQ
ncbi:MAG: MucB/RseB C-terminal domain-containing protein [Gammaproteobacteria bacterium]